MKKDLSEFKLEQDLERDCLALEAAESATSSSSSSSSLPTGLMLQGLHLVVLGHVDAGKSTLMGRLLHDVGAIGAKEVHRNEREAAQMGKASFSWAWALDERPEERARGVTVDVAMQVSQTELSLYFYSSHPNHLSKLYLHFLRGLRLIGSRSLFWMRRGIAISSPMQSQGPRKLTPRSSLWTDRSEVLKQALAL